MTYGTDKGGVGVSLRVIFVSATLAMGLALYGGPAQAQLSTTCRDANSGSGNVATTSGAPAFVREAREGASTVGRNAKVDRVAASYSWQANQGADVPVGRSRSLTRTWLVHNMNTNSYS